ncbi:hypothetical protein RhiirA4_522347 [Rhizophagus irregularis]|uniref:Uncharacterized protein n=1 Tax=Rhizophagus irregularis TaxID=588596 RepID=A0A2I1FXS4_9GLOM|nr:hypothetical protein RhiirA4_522347 [Rhizophagus irregularis]
MVKEKISKSSMVTASVGEEEVVDLVNRLDMNGHVTEDEVVDVIKNLRKKSVTGEVSVSKEEVDLYNKTKKLDIHKRCNKEELSKGVVSSDGTDEESGSEITSIIVAKKKNLLKEGKMFFGKKCFIKS